MNLIELGKMRREWVDVTRKNGFREGITDLLAHQYSEKTHFIFELLQNAEDAGATEVEFRVESQRLVFSHNGDRLFSDEDVESITSIGKSTKLTNYTQIGKHGIGFKAVFAYTHIPRIHSGDMHFDIEDVVIPSLLSDGDVPIDLKSQETRIILPFDSDAIPEVSRFRKLVPAETAKADISDALKKLNIRTLLFLRHIEEIRWTLVDGTKGSYLRESRSEPERISLRYVDVTDGDKIESWLVFEQEANVTDDGKDNKCIVEVAFLVENGKVVPARNTELVVYFPTEKKTGLAFLIQGPFITTKARDNIKSTDPANKELLKTAAHLAADSLETLRDLKLLDVSSYLALPFRVPEDSFFRPVYNRILETLRTKPLLPAYDGTFIKAREAKLARGKDLVDLFSPEQLSTLFGKQEVSWLDPSITETGPHSAFHAYLVGRKRYRGSSEWEIEPLATELEVDAARLAQCLNKEFLADQDISWLTKFIQYIVKNPKPFIEKRVPFVRLEDGNHVSLPTEKDQPTAYLPPKDDSGLKLSAFQIVERQLAEHKEIREFLEKSDVPVIDDIAIVVECILPKYTQDHPHISDDEHMRDMKKILHAYLTDSQKKKEQLANKLKKTAFIRAENLVLQQIEYKKPRELYIRNDDLFLYFYGNKDVWFISSEYDSSLQDRFKDLGVTDEIRIRCKPKNGSAEYVQLEYKNGYRRGLKGFDPDIQVDGFEYAIMNPSTKRSEIIWKKIAVKYSHCIKGKVLRSSVNNFSPNARTRTYKEEEMISNFGRLLIDTAWLPGSDGRMYEPSALTHDDLSESFVLDERLADQLGMKKNVVAKLAEESGIPIDVLEFAKQNPEKVKQLMADNAQKQKPAFPERASSNPERRREKLAEQLGDGPNKEYKQRDRSVRTTRGAVDPVMWLRNQYKNEDSQMICQVCKEEMPFRKRDGEHYFEAVEALSRDHFSMEHEAQFLALCPLCAAMYKEFVKQDEGAMVDLKNALMNTDDFEVPLRLGELTSIRFVETHYHDIKKILDEQE